MTKKKNISVMDTPEVTAPLVATAIEPTISPDDALLRVQGVSYRYGSYHALSDVTFSLPAGELVSLVGRNGAGKSTLLRCVSGWTGLTDGEVYLLDQPITHNERWVREHLVMVPDTPPFYDELTAWEHLQFTAQARRLIDWEPMAEYLMAKYGLYNNRNAFPFAYSRGMRYKLALCMALLLSPSLLLLDEPLGPLDPVSADELWIELNTHRDEGMTILLSSHQLPPDAQPDRYLIMEEGALIAQGTPDELRVSLNITDQLNLDTMLRAAIRGRSESVEKLPVKGAKSRE